MPKQPLIIFDMDGTLRVPGTVSELMPNVRSRLENIDWSRTLAAVASNQEGVARGDISAGDAMRHLQETLGKATGQQDPDWPVMMCPHGPKDRCLCRKPLPFMLIAGVAALMERGYELDDERVLYVGNEDRDEEAAKRAGIDFEWAEDFFG